VNRLKGSIQDVIFYSDELKEDINLLVYKPAHFTPLYKYQLLVTADGRDYFQLGRMARVCDELHSEKEIENLIVIGVPYTDTKDRMEKYHPQGSKHNAYIRFLAHELVPFLDHEFPTFQMGMGRALIGDSLGATISLLTAIKYPNTFGKVLLQSPYINNSVLERVTSEKTTSQLSIYHSIGLKETDVKTTNDTVRDFLTPNRELNKYLDNHTLSYVYQEFDGDHSWTYWQDDLKSALKAMFGS
jgi:enterochelin esterase-like enzyme